MLDLWRDVWDAQPGTDEGTPGFRRADLLAVPVKSRPLRRCNAHAAVKNVKEKPGSPSRKRWALVGSTEAYRFFTDSIMILQPLKFLEYLTKR
jgi:hypothetical protein